MFQEDTKKFYRNFGMKNLDTGESPSMAELKLTGKHYGGKRHIIMKEQSG